MTSAAAACEVNTVRATSQRRSEVEGCGSGSQQHRDSGRAQERADHQADEVAQLAQARRPGQRAGAEHQGRDQRLGRVGHAERERQLGGPSAREVGQSGDQHQRRGHQRQRAATGTGQGHECHREPGGRPPHRDGVVLGSQDDRRQARGVRPDEQCQCPGRRQVGATGRGHGHIIGPGGRGCGNWPDHDGPACRSGASATLPLGLMHAGLRARRSVLPRRRGVARPPRVHRVRRRRLVGGAAARAADAAPHAPAAGAPPGRPGTPRGHPRPARARPVRPARRSVGLLGARLRRSRWSRSWTTSARPRP